MQQLHHPVLRPTCLPAPIRYMVCNPRIELGFPRLFGDLLGGLKSHGYGILTRLENEETAV